MLVTGACALSSTAVLADSLGPVTVPSALPTISTSIAPTALPTLLATPLPTVQPTIVPSINPTPVPTLQAVTATPAPAPVGRPVAVGTAPPATVSPRAVGTPVAAPGLGPLPELGERLLDTPLGPAPPVAGLALLALSAALALRRRLRQLQRDRDLDTAKVGFLKVASHELRTPLTVIRGYVAMAGDGSLGDLPGRMRSVLPTLEGEVVQLERLVEQMLMAARLDENLLALERSHVDLREVVESALAALPEAPRHRVVLETGSAPVPVHGDPQRLGDVLANLVDNAIKYSPEGGEVTVRVDRRRGRATLAVTDCGLGIGPRDVPLLFTRFGRIVTPENSHIFGSGLGLYLVRELVRLHGGQVRATSVLGRGSTFSVELPLNVPAWARLLPARRPAPRATEAAG